MTAMLVLDTVRTEAKALNTTKFGKRLVPALKELSILLHFAQVHGTTPYAEASFSCTKQKLAENGKPFHPFFFFFFLHLIKLGG